jgi:chitinase
MHIIAYFPEWVDRSHYYPKDLIASGSAGKLTIINYAFGIPMPDPATGDILCGVENPTAAYAQVYPADLSVSGLPDDPHQPLRGLFNQFKQLKAKYPHLKIVVSLGGWTGSGYFSPACRTPQAREKFVAQCIDFFIQGNLPEHEGAGGPGAGAGVFDGIDLDWEYPAGHGLPTNQSSPEDSANYTLLCAEFRRQFAAIGRPDLLLTMAGAGPVSLAKQYNLAETHPYFDIIAIMSYDFVGVWHPVTGHHTNLFSSDFDPAPADRRSSADAAVKAYRDLFSVPPEKIAIGAAFYGKAWTEVGPENHGLYQKGKFLDHGGGSYRRLKTRLKEGFIRYWDDSACAPWLYNPDTGTYITYDDEVSIAKKAQYVKEWGLGGVMFWEITEDDEQGTLVDTIYHSARE